MSSDTVIAPSLSTAQDDGTFTYDKVKSTTKERKHLNLKNPSDTSEIKSKIWNYYSLSELIQYLSQKENNEFKYKRITLQFPDELICDSATIVHDLQRELNIAPQNSLHSSDCCQDTCEPNATQRIWILADTSYSACCVDEVAAEHVKSDLVVHFGDACLNEIDKLQAVFVLGRPTLDVEAIVKQISLAYSPEQKVVLMSDAPHTYLLPEIAKELPDYDILIANLPKTSRGRIIGYTPPATGYRKFNRVFNIEEVDFAEYELFHVTSPESPRLLQLATNFASVTTYDPISGTISTGPFPNLMRRYKYVHQARMAGTVGILVNTLSLANTKILLNTIKEKIREAGKKHYIFVVGKPNVAKLANFESVDIWCILGCDHQGIIIDQLNEYYRPIVTPYELLLGLSDELSWTGKWVVDYKSVLKEYGNEVIQPNQDADSDEDLPPVFDPVTGRYVSTSRPLRQINHLMVKSNDQSHDNDNDNDSQLVKRFSNAVAIKGTVSTSAIHLQNRHWTGLGSDYTEDENAAGALVEDGRKGIARGYDI
ncbi:diphthamide biosynthesis protein, putative [Candida dubliniensis CD36]|uniref:2-(3-amino-3-carboxypropyl)histidine synthase subunit 2 n=1 Tax=Candida dubliniensis (strain CD36 / ATCC MYA-646 / CBS 7987 / NCPF 3949 / NRRL Y-17841) TaxID=573826 RepID=B9WFC3_CANDC|nr:diphthamide biosynthesis protein, putative [Candida dubliniensis CD36]CAX41942.1 diphthamide biosynthesis protein, putative [Candida dubliniensis CD36]